jgi:hypothetical protein
LTNSAARQSGSRPRLEKVWSDWEIVSRASPKKNDPDFVEHSGLIFGVSASGRITTLCPAQFKPAQIAHDVRILASEGGSVGRGLVFPSAPGRPDRARCFSPKAGSPAGR